MTTPHPALTLADLAELKAKAEAAVPGPWCDHPNGTSVWTGREYDSMALQRHLFNATSTNRDAVLNVEFVAACDPQTVLALLAMARSHLQLVSALEFLDKKAFACMSYLDPRKPEPHEDTESAEDFTAQALVAIAEELGWTPETAESPELPKAPTLEPRPAVLWFAQQMELALRANDHKGGWHQDDPLELCERIDDELLELKDSLTTCPPPGRISEAADVANMAMMVADHFRKNGPSEDQGRTL